jgi:uncharacterized repeat protein (TIGR01451 family)
MKTLLRFAGTLFACFFLNLSQAQININDLTVGANLILNECGDADTMVIEIENNSGATITGVTLNDTLPPRILYQGYFGDATTVNTSNPQVPVFTLNDIPAGETDTIFVLVSADCGANTAASSYVKGHLLTYNGGTNTYDVSNDYISSIKAPNIQLVPQGAENFPSASLGSSYFRTYRVQNSGTNSTMDSFWFAVKYQNGLTFDSIQVSTGGGAFVTITPDYQAGDSLFHAFGGDLRNIGVFGTDYFDIREHFTFSNCPSGPNTSTVEAWRGCNVDVCQRRERNPSVQLASGIPNLTRTFSINKGCYGGSDTVTFTVINTGNEVATDVKIDVASTYNDYVTEYSSTVSYLDTNSVETWTQAGGVLSAPVPANVDTAYLRTNPVNRSFWSISAPPWRSVLSSTASLAPGDTMFFRIPLTRPCIDNSVCGATTQYHLNSQMFWRKACLTGGDYSTLRVSHFTERKRGTTYIDGPTDMADGDTAIFAMGFASNASYNLDRQNDSGFHRQLITYPLGLLWDKDTSQLTYQALSSALTRPVDSLVWDSTNRTLELFFFYRYPLNNIMDGTRANWFMTPKLYLDCSIGSANSPTTFETFDVPKPKSPCGACEFEYACVANSQPTMHCPGPCPRGGFYSLRADLRRINYGQPDNNQDGEPDGAGSLDFDKIQFQKVTARDTFELTYIGRVAYGTQSPTGGFDYGYGEIQIPGEGDRMTFVSGELEIDTGGGTPMTITGLTSTASTSGSTRTFTIDFSIGTGSGWAVGYDTFRKDDSITFKARFVFNPTIASATDQAHSIVNDFYLSDVPNPAVAADQYSCDQWGAKVYTTNAYHTVSSGTQYIRTNCNTFAVRFNDYLSIGECCSNYSTSIHFPYEYRSYAITDSIIFTIPEGYVVDSARYFLRHGTQVGNAKTITVSSSQIPPIIDGDEFKYVFENLYTTNGGTIIPSRGGYHNSLDVYLKPTCETPNNSPLPRNVRYYHSGINTWDGTSYTSSAPAGAVTFRSAELIIDNFGAVETDGISKVAEWDVRLQNDAAATTAGNSWIGFNSTSGNITVDSVRDLTSMMLLTESSGIYQAGDVLAGGSPNARIFKVYASYNNCIRDTIRAFSGWDCDGYPANLADYSCPKDSTDLVLVPLYPVLQTDLITPTSPPTVDMCDTVNYIVEVSQRDAARSYDNTIELDMSPGVSIVPDSSYVEFMGDNSRYWFNPVLISGNRYRFYVSDSVPVIGTNGLGVFAPPATDNAYRLRVRLVTDCDYVSGAGFRFIANGTAPCGDPLPDVTEFTLFRLTGAPAVQDFYPEIRFNKDTAIGCSDTLEVTALMRNTEGSPTSAGQGMKIVLPEGITYVASSTSFLQNPSIATEPAIGGDTLTWEWDGTDDIPAADSSKWTFRIATSSDMDCGTAVFNALTYEDFTPTCGGSSCPASFAIFNNSTGNIFASKSILTVTSNTVEIITDTGTKTPPDTLRLALDLSNTGLDTAGNYRLQVYEDDNMNGVIDAGDIQRIDKTISTQVAPSSSATLNEELIAPNYGAFACPTIVRIIPECDCNNDTIVSTSVCSVTALPVTLGYFDVSKVRSDQALISWQTLSEENNRMFVLERRATGASEFTPIHNRPGAGNSSQRIDYSHLDNIGELPNGKIYYRIKFVDFDGNYSYSEVKSILKTEFGTLDIFPNPTKDIINIQTTADQLDLLTKSKVTLTDAAGRIILETNLQAEILNVVDIRNTSRGIYTLSISNESGILTTTKIVVLH